MLRAYLFANYSVDVRPVINVTTVTLVNIDVTIIQIMDIVIIHIITTKNWYENIFLLQQFVVTSLRTNKIKS